MRQHIKHSFFQRICSGKNKIGLLRWSIYSKEHVQNVRSNLKIVIQDTNIMCKILLTPFHGSTRVQYYNLNLGSISNFLDLYSKLIAHLRKNIYMEKSSIKLFFNTQLEGENTRAYPKRFNEEILKVENLLEPMAIKALISGINNYSYANVFMHLLTKVFSM